MPRTQADRLPYLLYAVVFCACLSRSSAVVLAACLAGIAVLLWKVRQAGKLTLPYGVPLVLFALLAVANLVLLVSSQGITGPTETFVTFCDLVFQGEGQVMAPSGQEVTGAFVAQHQADYAAGNYDALWQAVLAEELSLATDTANLSP